MLTKLSRRISSWHHTVKPPEVQWPNVGVFFWKCTNHSCLLKYEIHWNSVSYTASMYSSLVFPDISLCSFLSPWCFDVGTLLRRSVRYLWPRGSLRSCNVSWKDLKASRRRATWFSGYKTASGKTLPKSGVHLTSMIVRFKVELYEQTYFQDLLIAALNRCVSFRIM